MAKLCSANRMHTLTVVWPAARRWLPLTRLTRGLTCSLLVLLLAACAYRPFTPPPVTGPASEGADAGAPARGSRYAMEHDSPLLEPFDPAQVQAVVPVRPVRTIAGNRSP